MSRRVREKMHNTLRRPFRDSDATRQWRGGERYAGKCQPIDTCDDHAFVSGAVRRPIAGHGDDDVATRISRSNRGRTPGRDRQLSAGAASRREVIRPACHAIGCSLLYTTHTLDVVSMPSAWPSPGLSLMAPSRFKKIVIVPGQHPDRRGCMAVGDNAPHAFLDFDVWHENVATF